MPHPSHSEDAAPVEAKIAYWRAIVDLGTRHRFDLNAHSQGLARACRRAARLSPNVGAYGEAADRWLIGHYGRADDQLRKAALAAAALDLSRRSTLPVAMHERRRVGHLRLAAVLNSSEPLDPGSFTRDVAFATGLAIPAGAMTVFVPPSEGFTGSTLRARRAAGQAVRRARQVALSDAAGHFRQVGLRPWAELHLDPRYLEDFNPHGAERMYLRLGELMRIRPELAGVCSASWFFDPALASISPRLAHLRHLPESGGARVLRLGPDADQTAFAVHRSPTRKRMAASGQYAPMCHGMYWTRSDILRWRDARAEEIPGCGLGAAIAA